MKKKKLWLSCIFLLFGSLKALSLRKSKRETVYILSFVVKEPDEKNFRKDPAEASKMISSILTEQGVPFTEYKAFETDGKTERDTREVLTFFLMMIHDEQAEELLKAIKESLGLKTAFCTKEEHSYKELKKQMQ